MRSFAASILVRTARRGVHNAPTPNITALGCGNLCSQAGLRLYVLHASADRDLDKAFASLVEQRIRGLVIGPDSFLQSRTEQIVALATEHAIPTVTPYREFAATGGLASYGGDLAESWRQAGIYTGRVLKGERPADLPVQQVKKFEMVINMKTARAFGLTIPPDVLAIADEVIE